MTHAQTTGLMLGYLRVSTADQADAGYGLAAQEHKLQGHAQHRGIRLEIFRDEGVSGKTLERPALMNALKLIASREADGLIVAKLDRLTRSVMDFALLLEWFNEAGAALVALDFDLDTSTPGGRLVATIMAGVAEWERGVISQRTRDGLAEVRAQGKPIGRPSVVDHPELTRRIREMRLAGGSLQAICDTLNLEGVPTLRGASEWKKSSLQAAVGYVRRPRRRRLAVLPEIAR